LAFPEVGTQPVEEPVPLLSGPPEHVSSCVQVVSASSNRPVASGSFGSEAPFPQAAKATAIAATNAAKNTLRRMADMGPP
jgi:hypothetical protein